MTLIIFRTWNQRKYLFRKVQFSSIFYEPNGINAIFFLDKSNRIVKTSAGQLAWSENAPLVIFLGESPSFVRHRKNLPIYQYRREILDQILSQRVVIVMGQTGCGKTTQLPQYILEEAYERKKPCRIICIQPHRILTIAAANQVTTERGMLAEEKKGIDFHANACIFPHENHSL